MLRKSSGAMWEGVIESSDSDQSKAKKGGRRARQSSEKANGTACTACCPMMEGVGCWTRVITCKGEGRAIVPGWTATDLAHAVAVTLQDVLVHQRPRWVALAAHQHQHEGWWNAEFILALDALCSRLDLPEPTLVLSEEKPSNHGIGNGRQSVDILVARQLEGQRKACPEPPRVWMEVKDAVLGGAIPKRPFAGKTTRSTSTMSASWPTSTSGRTLSGSRGTW